LALWAKSVRKAAKFTQWRPAPGKRRGADPTGLGLQGSPARSSVKRVAGRSPAGSRAKQRSAGLSPAAERVLARANRRAQTPLLDTRSEDEILGYGKNGLPE
jgi:hypothetical protein